MNLHYSNNWELLVSVMLSAQCTDKKVNEVTKTLFKKYKTVDDYISVSLSGFMKDIRPVGLHRSKAKNIIASSRMFKQKFSGRLPKTISGMLLFPGVGRKTANVVLGNAYGISEGIAIDTHVRRLARKLELSHNFTPEKIESDLMRIFPKKDWFMLTYYLIEYGRRYCHARAHNHEKCPLSKI
ncbi:MAG: Endonuclease III [Candidatus Jorgensenbacteria bacterium GW2011_GWA2_45_9]|nr:MAG: Endonuclease III [Candidatus Jorgensenbacteria bacterium GW2011_GWA2_45_9]